MVAFAFSVGTLTASKINATLALPLRGCYWPGDKPSTEHLCHQSGKVWGEGSSCPTFQLISLAHLFIFCIFAELVTHILIYGPENYLGRRELNNEKPAVKLMSSDSELLSVSMFVIFFL